MTLLITLTVADIDTGPFNLYSNVDLYTDPFAELIEKSVLLAGYTSTVVPDGTTSIEVRSVNELCNNFIILTVDATTSTTTSTTSTTTSTTTLNTSCSTCSIPNLNYGGDIWTGCNLAISTYRDGTPIPEVTDQNEWNNLTTGAWCYFDNDPANCATYGRLYNFWAVEGIYDEASRLDPLLRKKLAPDGYHVPNDGEWTALLDMYGGDLGAGRYLKSTGTIQAGTGLWNTPNTNADNTSGFTGLPGGYRGGGIGAGGIGFGILGNLATFWTSERDSPNGYPYFVSLVYDSQSVDRGIQDPKVGRSIRLVQDY